MKKLILMGLMLCLIVPFAFAETKVSPGNEFVYTQSFTDTSVMTLYAVDSASVTAASYDISATSITLHLTSEIGAKTTSFHFAEDAFNTIGEVIDWGNSYTFQGFTVYYTKAGTETAAQFAVWADSCSLITAGGLYPGTSNYVLGAKTLANLKTSIEADDGSTTAGLQGIWTIAITGLTTATGTSLATTPLAVNVYGSNNIGHFPTSPYAAAGEGWVFDVVGNGDETFVRDMESDNFALVSSSDCLDTLCTVHLATREGLSYTIPASSYGGQLTHIVNCSVYAVFTGTATALIYEDSTLRHPAKSLTTGVIYPFDFENEEWVTNENGIVRIRVDAGEEVSITDGWIRVYGFYR